MWKSSAVCYSYRLMFELEFYHVAIRFDAYVCVIMIILVCSSLSPLSIPLEPEPARGHVNLFTWLAGATGSWKSSRAKIHHFYTGAIVISSDFGSRRISRSSKRVKKRVRRSKVRREKGCSPTHIWSYFWEQRYKYHFYADFDFLIFQDYSINAKLG